LAYVNHVRLEAACRLLGANAAPVREVAARCGFPTLSTFNRNFMEAMGTTPQQWRNNASHRQYMPGKTNVQQYDGWL